VGGLRKMSRDLIRVKIPAFRMGSTLVLEYRKLIERNYLQIK